MNLYVPIETNPKEVYEEKAAAYLEDKERVKFASMQRSELAPVRMNYRRNYPYAFAQKIKEFFTSHDLTLLISALEEKDLESLVEFEKNFNMALAALNKTKTDSGWGAGELKAPKKYFNRSPKIEYSSWVEGSQGGENLISLCDEKGQIVLARMATTGGVVALSFD